MVSGTREVPRLRQQRITLHRYDEKQWLDDRDADRVEVYVGRLHGSQTPDDATWERLIKLAERLLIHVHAPPMNTQNASRDSDPNYASSMFATGAITGT